MTERSLGFASPLDAPLPPELGAAQPGQAGIRWTTAGEPLISGILRATDAELGRWLQCGQLAAVLVEPHGLLAWPGASAPATWAQTLQEILATELAQADTWLIEPAADLVLTFAANDVICGELGALLDSHGGQLRVTNVQDDRVEISLGGQCADCAIADLTLQSRLRGALSRRMGREIEIVDVAPRQTVKPSWLSLLRRKDSSS